MLRKVNPQFDFDGYLSANYPPQFVQELNAELKKEMTKQKYSLPGQGAG